MNNKRTPAFGYRSKFLALSLISSLALTGVPSSIAAPPPPEEAVFETITLPLEAQSAPDDLAVQSRASGNPKLDSTMAGLAIAARTSTRQAIELARSRSLRLSDNRVHVQVVTHAPGLENAVEAITGAGGEVTGVGNDDTLIQGWLPVDALETVAAQDDVYFIRRPAEVQLFENLLAGNSTTEGLAAVNGPAWHTAGYTGSGVKVAIIDGGFIGYADLLGVDLPASVTVKNFVDDEDDSQVNGTTEHGTACAEIVHDFVPDATLYLAKVGTNLDLAEAIAWAKDTHQVDIVSTSLGWYNLTPGDGTGEFANLVQGARDAGILWATAASNDREAHWGGLYSDPDADDVHNFNGTQEVNYFGPGDGNVYSIPSGYLITAFLRWDDWTNVNQDYDMYLLRWNGSGWDTIATSTDVQDGSPGQTPTEFAYAVTSGTSTAYGFVILRHSSTRNVNLEVFLPKVAPLDELLYARSLSNLADAPDAMTVAALDVTAPYPQESYSSEGPTNGPGGTETGGFTKPDISGFANVATESYPDSTFNGTSAATPHVAGAAALVLSAYPSYTPDQLQSFLEGRAVDMGSAGMDTLYGYGRLYLGDPPAGANTAPTISNLPDQSLFANTSRDNAIELWDHAEDAEDADADLTFSIVNSPTSDAGVSMDPDGHHIDINPAAGWTGATDVEIRVQDTGGLFDTDTFRVTVSAAADKTWNGSASSDWHTADNWTPAGVPDSGDDVLIPNVAHDPVISAGDAEVDGLTVEPGAVLDLTDRTLTVESALTNNGTLRQTQDVAPGSGTEFLHVTNLAGDQTKYYGVDITPSDIASAMRNLAVERLPIPSEPLAPYFFQGNDLVKPAAPLADVELIIDDGTQEGNLVLRDPDTLMEFRAVLFNHFAAAMVPSFPFTLERIDIHENSNNLQGEEIQLLVYTDASSGDPNDATLLYSEVVTVQNQLGWNVYTLTTPVVIPGSADILLGFSTYYADGGVSWPFEDRYPYPMDNTDPQGQSYLAWMDETYDPVDPSDLSSFTNLIEMGDIDHPCNWLVRGYGSGEDADIEISPVSFEETVPVDGMLTRALIISNMGVAPLTFSIREVPKSATSLVSLDSHELAQSLDEIGNLPQALRTSMAPLDLGDVVNSFSAPASGFLGLEWVDGYLWAASSSNDTLYKLDPTNGTILETLPVPDTGTVGLAWDGTAFWVSDAGADTIARVDTSGTVLLTFPAPSSGPVGLAWDGTYLWDVDFNADALHQIDPGTGAVLNTIPAPDARPAGVAWDGQYLWTNGRDSATTYQLDPADGSVLAFFSTPPGPSINNGQGAAFDGQYVWIANQDAGMVYQIDVEHVSTDVPWLSEDPISGMVPVSDSLAVDVVLDATGLITGDYTADLVITSNDPDENPVTVPITMHVIDAGTNTPPTLSDLPDQTVPMNSSADNAIDLWAYVDDAEDTDANLIFTIVNSPDSGAGVAIDSNRYVDINPAAGWTGTCDVEVQVRDTGGLTDTDTFRVTVTGSDPDVEVSPASFEETVKPDEMLTRTLTISNTGGSSLIFVASEGVSWLSEIPNSGTIPAGGSRLVDVIFSAAGLTMGDYTADLTIASNDPDENPVIVPITLHVTDNIPPILSGIPDQVVIPGSVYLPLDLWLYASDVESPDDQLTFAIDNTPAPNAGVSIESNRYVDINPTPGWTGQTTVVVRVTDPGGLSDTDTFLVTVGQYADIAVTPAFFDESVPQDETLVRTLTISNTGVDDLIFVIGDGGVAWLSQDPIAGTVPGGEAQPVDVTFDATGLAEGDYSTALTISNNDPDENPMTISVTMHVTITGELADVTVSVSGNQFCAGRTTGVERCFDIDSSVPLSATVRFYFGEGERNGQPLNDLLVFHYDGDWIEEPGPYTRGGAGDAQYVEAQNVDGFSPFALGRSGPATVYLPLVSRRWPPLPYTPVLNAISNADGDGNYTVSWQSALLANTYTLQEDDNASFSSPTTAYGPGSTTSTAISGRSIGTYYYRVKATNNYGDSSWSNVQTVIVRPPDTPTLNAISNADGDGNYSVSWNAADRAQTYTLQEDDNAAFSSPTTVYDGAGTSKSISGKGVGTYYYRVQASNGAGNSGWSNVASVVVTVPLPPCEQHDFGVQGTQYYIYPSGRSWNFTAESDMAVRSVQVKSVLATSSGHTFYIQVRINDSTVASWAQYVNNTTYTAFYHSKDVSFDMHTGDKITYHISIDSSVGGIAWMNYVKLCR